MLTQQVLIENLATAHGISGIKHSIPCEATAYEKHEEKTNQKDFQQIVGGLLYIARNTRPDISIQVNLLGRRTADPSPTNLLAARQLCQYLLTTRQEGVQYSTADKESGEQTRIEVYTDALYGGEGARSQTGVLVLMNRHPIVWYSRRQDTVSLSITEAEYIAACEGAKDAAWIQQLLKELLGTTLIPILYTDNEAADKLSKNQAYHRRTRHIQHWWHYLRQQVTTGELVIKGTNS